MTIPTPEHPIWSLLRLIVLALILWFSASDFDETELQALLVYGFCGEGPAMFRGKA